MHKTTHPREFDHFLNQIQMVVCIEWLVEKGVGVDLHARPREGARLPDQRYAQPRHRRVDHVGQGEELQHLAEVVSEDVLQTHGHDDECQNECQSDRHGQTAHGHVHQDQLVDHPVAALGADEAEHAPLKVAAQAQAGGQAGGDGVAQAGGQRLVRGHAQIQGDVRLQTIINFGEGVGLDKYVCTLSSRLKVDEEQDFAKAPWEICVLKVYIHTNFLPLCGPTVDLVSMSPSVAGRKVI